MANLIDSLAAESARTDMPVLAVGDTVKVNTLIVEGEKERVQVFQGLVIRVRGGGAPASVVCVIVISKR